MSPRFVFVLVLVAATVAAAGAGPARADVIYAGPTEQSRPVFVRENADGRVMRLFVSWQARSAPACPGAVDRSPTASRPTFLTAQGTRQHVFFDVANGRDGRDWGFVLSTRPGARLVVGHRYVVPSGSSAPSLVVSGDGHGCDDDGGSFLIRRATWDRRGRIVSLAASVFFTCDRTPAVRGSFWFRREYFRSAFPGA